MIAVLAFPLSWLCVWRRYQFCQFPQVLGGCSDEELIAGTIRSSKSQSSEPENAFEMGKQHLYLFAQTPRFLAFRGFGNVPRHVTSALVD